MMRLTPDMFQETVGDVFKVTTPDASCHLTLDQVVVDPQKNAGDFVHFKLVFNGPDEPLLPQ